MISLTLKHIRKKYTIHSIIFKNQINKNKSVMIDRNFSIHLT